MVNRVVQKGHDFYPQFRSLFMWCNYHEEIGWGCIIDVKCRTKEDALAYIKSAEHKTTVEKEIVVWKGKL